MNSLENGFSREGYLTVNQAYPSRDACVEDLSGEYVQRGIDRAKGLGAKRIHFVTHSMGGILLRHYLSENNLPELGRVVMIAPPNKGSEVVDVIGHWRLFYAVNGPAGIQLGTGDDGIWNSLPRPDYPVGVIAGTRSINWINSMMILGKDDGKVSINKTKVDGMKDFCTIGASHPILLWRKECVDQSLSFIKNGEFEVAELDNGGAKKAKL